MSETEKRKRGGDVKRAPRGFYTARQAQIRLGMNKQMFYRQVEAGVITRVQLPLSKDGFYVREEIDLLADERTLALLEHMVEKRMEPTLFRAATEEDAQGISNVLASLGWAGPSTDTRRAWYTVNNQIDYVVVQNEVVMGYVSITPYTEEALEARMAGKGSAAMHPSDILPFHPGSYDVFIGIATRDVPHRARYSKRLIFGVRRVLEEWAMNGIVIRRMCAVSAEKDGQELCDVLGFERLPSKEGDTFPRYVLDLETSPSQLAQQYREYRHTHQYETKEKRM